MPCGSSAAGSSAADSGIECAGVLTCLHPCWQAQEEVEVPAGPAAEVPTSVVA
jgi:hypothetical protein